MIVFLHPFGIKHLYLNFVGFNNILKYNAHQNKLPWKITKIFQEKKLKEKKEMLDMILLLKENVKKLVMNMELIEDSLNVMFSLEKYLHHIVILKKENN
jgi:hypothetical protein